MEEKRRKAKLVAGPANPVIPDKLYFRIGEVAALLGIAAYVLRFWEDKFPQLNPSKGGTGQRLYRRRDVEMALRIKGLLYYEGYTIPGARQFLKTEVRERQPELPLVLPAPAATQTEARTLRRVRSELEEIAGLLARPLPGARRVTKAQRKAGAAGSEHGGLHVAGLDKDASSPKELVTTGDRGDVPETSSVEKEHSLGDETVL